MNFMIFMKFHVVWWKSWNLPWFCVFNFHFLYISVPRGRNPGIVKKAMEFQWFLSPKSWKSAFSWKYLNLAKFCTFHDLPIFLWNVLNFMKMLIFMEFGDSDPPNRGRGLGGGAPHRATPRHFDYLYSIGFASRGCQGSAWILSGAKYPETCRGIRRRRRAMVGHAAPFRGAASDFFNTSRNIWPRRGSKRILGIRGTQIRSSIDSRNDEVWSQ